MKPEDMDLAKKLEDFNEQMDEHRIRSFWLTAISDWRTLYPLLKKKVNGDSDE